MKNFDWKELLEYLKRESSSQEVTEIMKALLALELGLTSEEENILNDVFNYYLENDLITSFIDNELIYYFTDNYYRDKETKKLKKYED